jgi:hypothetical protein
MKYKKENPNCIDCGKLLCRYTSKRCRKCNGKIKRGINNPFFGKKHTKESKEKISLASKGRKLSTESRIKLSENRKGEKGSNWRGGLSTINKIIRKSIEYRLWREAVFSRDNWTCQKCKKRGKTLHPHHIKGFALYPELRFAIDNGITLCEDCHKLTPNYGKPNSK